ncbi:MAG: NAD(P)-dependent alcohol dehydrogenase [Actinomycetota bacterium]|nr:NAD(P)-dependent alcohol dehydrogenase [Actinomycetota bacterium]
MKAIIHDRYDASSLELRHVPEPVLEDDQVLVRVYASSVNPVEWYRVHGPFFVRVNYGVRRPKSPTIGADLAGRIEAVGKDVTEFRPGDEVFGTSGGSWAEYAAARAPRLVEKPANVSFEEAAAVPVAGLTALQAVRDHGRIQPGQKVLVNGASGGVGTFAVQIAKAFGAEVTAVCSTSKVDLVGSLGADHVCDYTREDFTRSRERYDVMLDVAGSRRFSEYRRVLKPEATVVAVGAPMSNKGLGPLKHIVGTRVGSLGRSQNVVNFVAKIEKADLLSMRSLLEAGTVKPVIDRRYELRDVAEALRYLGEGHARGKVVITA